MRLLQIVFPKHSDKQISEADIYPNPCSLVLNIRTASPAEKILISDSKGNMVLSPADLNQEIDITLLDPGLYLCVLNDGKKVISKPFVKE